MTAGKKQDIIAVEFHCHTDYSRDSSNEVAELITAAREKGIDRLAVTDHNTIRGALAAKALAPELIIVGEEILTERGELIAYFVSEEIPRGTLAAEALARLKAQNAFISIPHPFDWRRHGWREEELLELLPQVDAVEVFNARCLQKSYNDRALALALEHDIPMLAGSDAHSLVELGLALTYLPPFNSADELRAVVRQSLTSGRMLTPADHFRASAMIAASKLFPVGKKQ
jgi:predicted metal-dependent phosphoesterase TrpH